MRGVNKMARQEIFEGTPKLRKKIWFYLTCWRPITLYEFANLQIQLIDILEAMREGEMMHCQMEKMLDNEIRKMKDGIQKPPKDEKQDNMFN
jgi:hypothetical protein